VDVREEVRRLAQPLADDSGLELVDVELHSQGRHRVLRVLLDMPGGVTVGACARFSRRLSDCLDMNQTMPWAYHLEVSSPGIQRPLRTLDSTLRFAGQRVALETHEPQDGRRHFEGELLAPVGQSVGLRTDDGIEHRFEWGAIRNAHLVVDPWARVRRDGGTR
jgi:ribosome maturation factor RimP